MRKTVSFLLVGYGGLVAALGLLTQQFAPDLARPTFWAGVVGGGLSAVWGALGIAGKPHRGWAIFTMAATGFVLLSQAVTHWMPAGEPNPGTRALALLATAMLLVTVGALVVVAHAGAPDAKADSGSEGAGSVDGNSPGSGTAPAWREARRRRASSPNVKP